MGGSAGVSPPLLGTIAEQGYRGETRQRPLHYARADNIGLRLCGGSAASAGQIHDQVKTAATICGRAKMVGEINARIRTYSGQLRIDIYKVIKSIDATQRIAPCQRLLWSTVSCESFRSE